MPVRKLALFLFLGLFGVFLCGFAQNEDAPDNSQFVPYTETANGSALKSFSDTNLPWIRSSATEIFSGEDYEALELYMWRYLSEREIEESLYRDSSFYKPTAYMVSGLIVREDMRGLGGVVAWPTLASFGEFVPAGGPLAITVRNISTYSAPESNMLFNTLDDSLSPTTIRWVKEFGFTAPYTIDLSKEFLIPKGTSLVIAEVVAEDGAACLPSAGHFSVQVSGYPSVDVIRDSRSQPVQKLGKYPLLRSEGCSSSGWIFALVPTDDVALSDLYIKYDSQTLSPQPVNWDVTWRSGE